MSAGMAGVIAAHSHVGVDPASTQSGPVRWACYGCGAVESDPSDWTFKADWHGTHLAEELAKAGYGNVPAALLAAADEMPIENMRGRISKATVWLRQRAHSLDPEGHALVKAIHERKAGQ